MDMTVDINADLGESFGNYKLGLDSEILDHISSANIACGMHAGDPLVMRNTVRMALDKGVSVGAHPGYPDLQGFGRRSIKMSYDEIYAYVVYQVGAMKAMVESEGGRLAHVKPHGALYNDAAKDNNIALAIVDAVYAVSPEILFYGLSGSVMINVAGLKGLRTVNEVFADRAYNDDGSLVSRSMPGAMLHDAELCAERVVGMVSHGELTSINGNKIQIKADTVCVHGDNPEALEFVKKMNKVLNAIM